MPDQCVYGGYRFKPWAGETNPTQLNPAYDARGICKVKAGGCSAAACIGKCCPSIGKCPTSSCKANQLGTEERK